MGRLHCSGFERMRQVFSFYCTLCEVWSSQVADSNAMCSPQEWQANRLIAITNYMHSLKTMFRISLLPRQPRCCRRNEEREQKMYIKLQPMTSSLHLHIALSNAIEILHTEVKWIDDRKRERSQTRGHESYTVNSIHDLMLMLRTCSHQVCIEQRRVNARPYKEQLFPRYPVHIIDVALDACLRTTLYVTTLQRHLAAVHRAKWSVILSRCNKIKRESNSVNAL